MRHTLEKARPFEPTGKGGGSKPGKPQWTWPEVMKVVAAAVAVRAAGSEKELIDNKKFPLKLREFDAQMSLLLPGWKRVCDRAGGKRKTNWASLLKNRPYKIWYAGTSDRGTDHDPKTRAAPSKEHWRRRVPCDSPLVTVYNNVVSNRVSTVDGWHEYLEPIFKENE